MQLPWKKAETDLEREVRFHLDALVAQYESEGMSPAEARRRARLEFGGPEQVKEACREESRWHFLSEVRRDLDFGLRMLRKAPGVSFAAVLSLALGIGANTAIFSLMNAVLWKTLPVPEPRSISVLKWQSKGWPDGPVERGRGTLYNEDGQRVGNYFSFAAYRKMQTESRGRAVLTGYLHTDAVTARAGSETVMAEHRPVAGNFFEVLRVPVALGRGLQEADDDPAAEPTVVVTHRFWEAHLGSDPRTVGRALTINARPHLLVGVLPASFTGIQLADATDLYVPFHHSPALRGGPGAPRFFEEPTTWWVQILARREARVSSVQLGAFLDGVFRSTWTVPPRTPQGTPRLRAYDGSKGLDDLQRRYAKPLRLLFALVVLVLVIACANVANLLLARAEARRKEIALRLSIGAGRGRLLRQLLTESGLLAVLGGLLSLAFAVLTVRVLLALLRTSRDSFPASLGLDLRTLAAASGFTLLAVLAFGLLPAWRASGTAPVQALKEGSGSLGVSARSWWTPAKMLVVFQVAFSLLLVVAATLFTRNLRRIDSTDPGFERENLLVFDVRPGQLGRTGAELRTVYLKIEERLSRVPGIRAVGLAGHRPLFQSGDWNLVLPPGSPAPLDAATSRVTPGALRALGLKVLSGRSLTDGDVLSGAKVVLVSEELASRLGSLAPPVGRRFHLGSRPEGDLYEVVGVVANAAYSDLKERPSVAYFPNALADESLTVIVRTEAAPFGLLPSVRDALREVDADLAVVQPLTMEQQIRETLASERLFAFLCSGLGGLALLLAAIGLYGVISYAMARRQNELGVRMALGATRGNVVGLVLKDGLHLVGLGILVGTPLVLLSARFARAQLYDMEPLDPTALVLALASLAGAALVAMLVPAIRTSMLAVSSALRHE
ncbi:MAG: ABC transporter permease [Acidobacteria bacterium]|nr:ABC transporter permease [Acidobacteriota bacterium]